MFSLFDLFKQTQSSEPNPQNPPQEKMDLLHEQLNKNTTHIKHLFSNNDDFLIYPIASSPQETAIAYIDNLTDKDMIQSKIIQNLLYTPIENPSQPPIALSDIKKTTSWQQIQHALCHGSSVLFIDGETTAFLLNTSKVPKRTIDSPKIEQSIRGGHIGFIENGNENIALIRNFIPDTNLKVKQLTVGRRGDTTISILYLQDVANPELLQELVSRIQRLNIDAIINAGELVEHIEDNTFSPFPQLLITERPDHTAFHILEGRYAIIVDRTPGVIIAPVTFFSFFQSIDDYSMRWMITSVIRSIRYFAFFIGLFLPAMYIAFLSFNYEIIPTQLILSIAESRERVPFHPLTEALLMEVSLEMMREAGIRIPMPISQAVGILGGIIIGQTAIQAGIVSNIMVIVIALTAIGSFIIPNYDMGATLRFLRLPLMILAYLFGMIGIVLGAICLFGHLVSLHSLNMPYSSPFAPVKFRNWPDIFIRFPLRYLTERFAASKPLQNKRAKKPNVEREKS